MHSRIKQMTISSAVAALLLVPSVSNSWHLDNVILIEYRVCKDAVQQTCNTN
jgi:hypothetical protein